MKTGAENIHIFPTMPEVGAIPEFLYTDVQPSRIRMLEDFEDGGETRKRRNHYPVRSYADPLIPPDICPRCHTPLHQEGENLYCQNRNHSWAIPIPDEHKKIVHGRSRRPPNYSAIGERESIFYPAIVNLGTQRYLGGHASSFCRRNPGRKFSVRKCRGGYCITRVR